MTANYLRSTSNPRPIPYWTPPDITTCVPGSTLLSKCHLTITDYLHSPPPLWEVDTSNRQSTPPQDSTAHLQLGHELEEGRSSGKASGRPSDPSTITSPITPPSTLEPGTEASPARARFMNLVRSAVMVNRLIGLGDEAKAKVSSSLTAGKAADRKPTGPVTIPRSSRVVGLVPMLQSMAPTQDIAAHTALVRHIQVSVNLMVTFELLSTVFLSSLQMGISWPHLVWIVLQLYSTSGYVAFMFFLHCKTERSGRNKPHPIVYCCTPPDPLVRLHGKDIPLKNRRTVEPPIGRRPGT